LNEKKINGLINGRDNKTILLGRNNKKLNLFNETLKHAKTFIWMFTEAIKFIAKLSKRLFSAKTNNYNLPLSSQHE